MAFGVAGEFSVPAIHKDFSVAFKGPLRLREATGSVQSIRGAFERFERSEKHNIMLTVDTKVKKGISSNVDKTVRPSHTKYRSQ